MDKPATILALDVGDRRIGVAVANTEVRLASPLATLNNDSNIWQKLSELAEHSAVQAIVVGLPRNLDGKDTEQTKKVRVFMAELRANLGLPVHAQDEATTSLKAEEELKTRGKPYVKGDIDALAATYILEDFLNEQRSN